jgi:hypothetical protein
VPDKPAKRDPANHLDTEEAIRRTAYFLWQQDGSPDGQAEKYWRLAREKVVRERAYDLWLKEGTPEGRAEDHWRRIEAGEMPRKR